MNIRAQLIMPYNLSFGIQSFQLTQYPAERFFLRSGSGIRRLTQFIQSTFIANRQTVQVESERVCANLTHWAGVMQRAILRHIKMIPDTFEATFQMALEQLLLREGNIRTGSTAMHNDIQNAARHIFLLQRELFQLFHSIRPFRYVPYKTLHPEQIRLK